MKMDLRGYFMNINRSRLLEICRSTLFRMRYHRVGSGCREVWDDVLDFDFVDYLTETIVLLDPVKPWRRYVSSQCLSRMKRHIADLEISVRGMPSDAAALRVRNSLCSFLGVLSHPSADSRRLHHHCNRLHNIFAIILQDFISLSNASLYICCANSLHIIAELGFLCKTIKSRSVLSRKNRVYFWKLVQNLISLLWFRVGITLLISLISCRF